MKLHYSIRISRRRSYVNGNIDRRQDVRNLANNINCRGHIEPKARYGLPRNYRISC